MALKERGRVLKKRGRVFKKGFVVRRTGAGLLLENTEKRALLF